MFVAVTMQAFPFLVLGVVLSGTIATLIPPSVLTRLVPKRSALALPVAGLAGVALPGCECASVPIAGRLIGGGMSPPAALTFLLAAPAINPVVLVATSVAFPGRPQVVAARFLASLATALLVGSVWTRRERRVVTETRNKRQDTHERRFAAWCEAVLGDFLHAGGYLVLGGATAATLQTLVSRRILDALGGNGPTAVLTMAVLAVILAVCSEADAFVASSLTQFSMTARLVFLVVGPVVDVKLIAMHVATFGRPFAARFSALTLVSAIVMASLFGWILL